MNQNHARLSTNITRTFRVHKHRQSTGASYPFYTKDIYINFTP